MSAGEMLGDHGDYAKQLPWQGSASVPLMCAGPGVKAGQVISMPVGTVDLSATFMDFAGATRAPGMTAVSLRSLLEGQAARTATNVDQKYRDVVHSGLLGKGVPWRMVMTTQAEKSYKLVCCQGECPTPPTTVPPPFKGWTTLLICVTDDPYDMHDLAREPAMRPLLSKMMDELPPAFANGCGKLIE